MAAMDNANSRSTWDRFTAWWNTPNVGIEIHRWMTAAGALVLLGIVFLQAALVLVGVGVALVALALRLWWDFALVATTYTRRFSTRRAFHGDEVTVTLETVNLKPLPVTRLEVAEYVTKNVEIPGRALERAEVPNRWLFRTLFSLGFYERVDYRYTFRTQRRGWYRFGPATLTATDPFGIVRRKRQYEAVDGVLTYPRVVPLTHVIVPARQPYGDFKPPQSLLEDPMRIAGVRQYEAGDSMRRIHWRATARIGELQTRVSEPTATPIAAIFLDTITFSHLWEGQQSDLLELAVVVAASLSAQLLEGRYQVGMYANAPIPEVSRSVRIAPGRRPGQLAHILERLAMIAPAFGARIEQMMTEEIPRLPWGASMVVVTCRVTPTMQRMLLRLARSTGNQRVVLVAIGDRPELLPELRRRVPVYHLGRQERWDELEQITLQPLV
ncbi:MAG TPA: DUF58 domain-containing protein [Thermomicrobiales bacterium]|nr:DUF58 domain-containing protein [Thermomicrobiales bacterium]